MDRIIGSYQRNNIYMCPRRGHDSVPGSPLSHGSPEICWTDFCDFATDGKKSTKYENGDDSLFGQPQDNNTRRRCLACLYCCEDDAYISPLNRSSETACDQWLNIEGLDEECQRCGNKNQENFTDIVLDENSDDSLVVKQCEFCHFVKLPEEIVFHSEPQIEKSLNRFQKPGSLEVKYLNKIVSELNRCTDCGNNNQTKFSTITLDEGRVGFDPLAMRQCMECFSLHGADDSMSQEETATWLQSLSVELCKCGNTDPFLYVFKKEDDTLALECQCCRENITITEKIQIPSPDPCDLAKIKKSKVVGRIPVKSNAQLKPGDHIALWKKKCWHHLLVIEVIDEEWLVVIHYNSTDGKFNPLNKGRIMEEEFNLAEASGLPYQMVYDGPLNTPEEAIRRARCRLGEEGYDIFSNNCEHFVTKSLTGIGRCEQVQQAKGNVGRAITQGTTSVLGNAADEVLLLAANAGDDVVIAGSKAVGKNVVRGASNLAKALPYVVPAAVITGIELFTVGKTAYDAYQKKKNGYIDQREFINIVVGKSIKSSVRGGLGVAGACLGQFLCPIPIVGGIVGGLVGTALGHVIGSLCDREFNKYRSFSGRVKKD